MVVAPRPYKVKKWRLFKEIRDSSVLGKTNSAQNNENIETASLRNISNPNGNGELLALRCDLESGGEGHLKAEDRAK